jgi:predicted anti-sigma-YlaC factor YlaD
MARSIDCHLATAIMWPYLDEELSSSPRYLVAAHLASCQSCRGLFEFNRAFLVAVRSAMRARPRDP